MRYCASITILAMLSIFLGCQTAYQQGGILRHLTDTPAVAPGTVPPYFNPQMGPGNGMYNQGNGQTSQVQFLTPQELEISVDGMPVPYPHVRNIVQGRLYQMELANIPNTQGRSLYPTLEIAPASPRTQAFLDHNMVPIEFTDNDFDQVFAGNFVTKVIYLPNPEFQGLATAGVGTLVNTQLEPGVDPISEAKHRGSILAVIRIGNKDLSLGNSEQIVYMRPIPQPYAERGQNPALSVPMPPIASPYPGRDVKIMQPSLGAGTIINEGELSGSSPISTPTYLPSPVPGQ